MRNTIALLVLLPFVLIGWRSDLSKAKKVLIQKEINSQLGMDAAFLWAANPTKVKVAGVEWRVASFRTEQLRRGADIDAARLQEILAKIDSVDGFKIVFSKNPAITLRKKWGAVIQKTSTDISP